MPILSRVVCFGKCGLRDPSLWVIALAVGDGSYPLRYCPKDLVSRAEMATFRAARAFKLVFCRLFGYGLFDYGDLASGSTCFQTSVLSFVWLRGW